MAKKKKKKKINSNDKLNARRKKKLIQKAQQIVPEVKKIIEGKQDNKLSEAIIDFAEPLLSRCPSPAMQKRALALAILIWNISLLPPNDAARYLADLTQELAGNDKQEREEIKEILEFMMHRKQTFFPDDRRLVTAYNITRLKDGRFHLDVAYHVEKD